MPARLAPLIGPAAVGLLALLLGLYRVGERSIWLDESSSIFVAEVELGRFVELITHSKLNMSLYFTLLRPWTTLGSGEGVVRSLSVLLAAGAVPFLYLAVRRLIDERSAVLASLALALNGFFVDWAQQARGYGLAMLLASAATYLLTRLVAEPRARWWVAYGLVAGLGLYAHVFSSLVVVAHAVALALVWRDRAILRRAALGIGLAGVVAAPMVLAVLFGRASAIDWVGALSLDGLRVAIRNLSGGGWAIWLYVAGVLLSGAVLVAWLRRGDPRARGLALLLCWALVPFALSVAVSLIKPVLVPRYLLVSLPALAAVMVIGFTGLIRESRISLAVGAAVLLVAAVSLPAHYVRADPSDYRGLTAAVARRALPGDAVTWWTGFHSRPSIYYARRLGLVDQMPPPIATNMRWTGNPYSNAPADPWPSDCLPGRIWLVGGPARLPLDPVAGRATTLVDLLSGYRQSGPIWRLGDIRLRLYLHEPGATPPTCAAT